MYSVHFQKNYLGAFLIIFGVLFLVFITSGSLFAEYHFIDEHWIISLNHDLQGKNFIEELFKATTDEFFGNGGRFRPVFISHIYIESKLFGINRFMWSLYTGTLVAITAFFLFVFARLIQFSLKEALFFSLLSIVGPQLEIGFHLLDNETSGMFFLSVALIFTVLSIKNSKNKLLYELLFITSILLMSLSKESFILLIPTMAFIKIWQFCNFNTCSWRQSINNNVLSLFIILAIFFSELLYIKYLVGTDIGRAGIIWLDFPRILRAAYHLTSPRQMFGLIILIAFIFIILIHRRNNLDSKVFLRKILSSSSFVLFTLIVLPQILLYAKSGFDNRYIVPGILGYSILIVQMSRYIYKNAIDLGKLIYLLIFLCLIFKFYDAWRIAHDFTIEGKTTRELLNLVEKNTVINDHFLIVANPFVYREWAFSIGIYLNYLEKRNNLYLITYGSQRSDFITNTLSQEEKGWAFLNPETLKRAYKTLSNIKNKDLIHCVVVPPKLKHDFLISSSDWFNIQYFNEYTFDFSSPRSWLGVKYENLKDSIAKHFFHMNNKSSVVNGNIYYVYLKK